MMIEQDKLRSVCDTLQSQEQEIERVKALVEAQLPLRNIPIDWATAGETDGIPFIELIIEREDGEDGWRPVNPIPEGWWGIFGYYVYDFTLAENLIEGNNWGNYHLRCVDRINKMAETGQIPEGISLLGEKRDIRIKTTWTANLGRHLHSHSSVEEGKTILAFGLYFNEERPLPLFLHELNKIRLEETRLIVVKG